MGTNKVDGGRIAAIDTGERLLSLSVGLVDRPTFRTSPADAAWIVSRSDPFKFGASIGAFLAVVGEVDDAAIDPGHVPDANRLRVGRVADDGETPLVADQHQVDLALAVGQGSTLTIRVTGRESSIERLPGGQQAAGPLILPARNGGVSSGEGL